MRFLLCILSMLSCLFLVVGCSESQDLEEEKKVVGPSGGVVANEEGVEVNIPSGSLEEEVEISIVKRSGQEVTSNGEFRSVSELYEFLPAGTVFEIPITVTIPYNPATVTGAEENVAFFWGDTLDGEWERLEGSPDLSSNTISSMVSHFSFGYAGELESGSDGDSDTDLPACGTTGGVTTTFDGAPTTDGVEVEEGATWTSNGVEISLSKKDPDGSFWAQLSDGCIGTGALTTLDFTGLDCRVEKAEVSINDGVGPGYCEAISYSGQTQIETKTNTVSGQLETMVLEGNGITQITVFSYEYSICNVTLQ